jgi:hypothetical protein
VPYDITLLGRSGEEGAIYTDEEGAIYTDEDYARAEAFTPWRMETRLPGVAGPVEWLPDSSRFCFRLGTAGGWRFQLGSGRADRPRMPSIMINWPPH